MLIRILGGVMICAACGLLGLYMSHRGVARARLLAEFKQSLTMLKSEIEYAAYPMPQAFSDIANATSENLAAFYDELSHKLIEKEMSLADAWEIGLAKFQNTQLTAEDMRTIGNLGRSLGNIDAIAQIQAIDLTIKSIDEILARLAMKNAKDGKMYKQLGLLGGALIVVVLI